jgi:hypothetical protein
MKKLYLVISATVIIAVMGYVAWKISSSRDQFSDTDQPGRTAHQDNGNTGAPITESQVILLPPDGAPDTEIPTSSVDTGEFKLPPDGGTPAGTDSHSQSGAPGFVMPPSAP